MKTEIGFMSRIPQRLRSEGRPILGGHHIALFDKPPKYIPPDADFTLYLCLPVEGEDGAREFLETAEQYAREALQFTGDYTVTDADKEAQDRFIAKCEELQALLPEKGNS